MHIENQVDNLVEDQMGKDNIQVYVRVRPLNQQEQADGNKKLLENDRKSIYLKKNSKEKKTFTFDSIFSEGISQEQIFKQIGKNLIENFLNGYNCSIFAYGQTGAGKTYTMMGDLEKENFKGLKPRCIEYLFYLLNEKMNPDTLLKVTYVEIYNERIIDLLSEDLPTVNIREDLKKGVFLDNVNEVVVTHYHQIFDLLKKGMNNRHVSETLMNSQSSRSHSIFTIHFQTCQKKNDCCSYKTSMFNFIDLAGSERYNQTKATGDRFKEGCNINKSLTVLGYVINSLADQSKNSKSKHIRYRDSKLTFLLKNSLGGNSKTAFIANVSPSTQYFVETLSTLHFAKRAKLIKNVAKINENVKSKSLKALQVQLMKTKEELNMLKEKYYLLEQNQFTEKFDMNGQCVDCQENKKNTESKILELNHILKESLIILRKSMLTWEQQLNESDQQPEFYQDIISLLKDNTQKIKQLGLILGIECTKREFTVIQGENEREKKIIDYFNSKIKYYETLNMNQEKEQIQLQENFFQLEEIVKNYMKDKNLEYEKIKNKIIIPEFNYDNQKSLSQTDKKNQSNIQILNKKNEELRISKEEKEKLQNEIQILIERNKMLKSWNEQTLQDKKILNSTIEKMRYEKFSLIRNFDEEFENTKNQNERLIEEIENLEREKNILQEGYDNQEEQIQTFRKQNEEFKTTNKQLKIQTQELQKQNDDIKIEYEKQNTLYIQQTSQLKEIKKNYDIQTKKLDQIQIDSQIQKQKSEVLINNLNQKDSLHQKYKNEIEQKIKEICDESNQIKSENFSVLETRNEIAQNLGQYVNRCLKSEKSNVNLIKQLNSLKFQNRQFFNVLIEIKNKIQGEGKEVFEDFIVATQVKNENKILQKQIKDKDKEINTLKSHVKNIYKETEQKSIQLQKIQRKLQLKYEELCQGLEFKDQNLKLYKSLYEQDENSYTNFMNIFKQKNIHVQNPQIQKEQQYTFLKKKNVLEEQKMLFLNQTNLSEIKKVRFVNFDQSKEICKKINFNQLIQLNYFLKQYFELNFIFCLDKLFRKIVQFDSFDDQFVLQKFLSSFKSQQEVFQYNQ